MPSQRRRTLEGVPFRKVRFLDLEPTHQTLPRPEPKPKARPHRNLVQKGPLWSPLQCSPVDIERECEKEDVPSHELMSQCRKLLSQIHSAITTYQEDDNSEMASTRLNTSLCRLQKATFLLWRTLFDTHFSAADIEQRDKTLLAELTGILTKAQAQLEQLKREALERDGAAKVLGRKIEFTAKNVFRMEARLKMIGPERVVNEEDVKQGMAEIEKGLKAQWGELGLSEKCSLFRTRRGCM